MIDKIHIKNFKSIVDLKLDLGRFNVIIGSNGSGKTNILEAITLASIASQDKLDMEFLANRDVRMPEPQFMFNAFSANSAPATISTIPQITLLIFFIFPHLSYK